MTQKGKVLKEKLQSYQKKKAPFRISLRYKFAFPVLLLVTLLLLLLFRTTFRTVRSLTLEHAENRLQTVAEVFAETVKVPLILKNQQVLLAHIEWLSSRPDVQEVRVEDAEGTLVSKGRNQNQTVYASITQKEKENERNFLGVKKKGQDTYLVAVPIRAHERRLGRVVIVFNQQGFEKELRDIFEQRLMVAFIMAFFLALLIGGVTWLAIRPLFTLKRTAQQILAGDLSARAHVDSYDEIQDVGEAFNEMVSRLATSLDHLRARTEALEESEEKYRLIVENSSDIIFTFTPEGEISLLNREISGLTHDEILQGGMKSFLQLFLPEAREKFEEELAKVSQTKIPVINLSVEQKHIANHTEISYLINLTPMLDHDDNIKLVQCVMRDVTELRRIEMMKDSLIRDVAHELKTPTAKFEMAVGWFENELVKNRETERYKEVLTILKSNTDRLMKTITSIMDLTKIESGMQKVVRVPMDLNEVLAQVCQDLEPLCRQKGLVLENKLSKEKLMMEGDRDMLYRVFVNLIGNSAKFTEEGTITLSSFKQGGKVSAIVKDTGLGIEKEFLEKIFERFVQKTASSLGIGVGLTISKDIVRMHDGKVWSESEGLGKGASFKVEFPSLA